VKLRRRSAAAGAKAAKDSLAEMKQENPEIGQSARLGNGQGQNRWQQRRAQRAGQNPAPTQQGRPTARSAINGI